MGERIKKFGARYGGTHLQSQHLGGWGRWISCSRPVWATQQESASNKNRMKEEEEEEGQRGGERGEEWEERRKSKNVT
jgi:hypothetical protein